MTIYHSKWIAGKNAGGSGSDNQRKFWENPQFLIKLDDVDKDDNENKGTMIVALMQKDSRLKRQSGQDPKEEFIQFRVFKVIYSLKKYIFLPLTQFDE